MVGLSSPGEGYPTAASSHSLPRHPVHTGLSALHFLLSGDSSFFVFPRVSQAGRGNPWVQLQKVARGSP